MLKKALLVISLGSLLPLQAQLTSAKNCETKTAGNNVGDTGCVQFTYQNKTVSYVTVRAADGNEWLQQNLGSSNVATSKVDEDARGDYFQFGRWDDGHQLKNSKTSEDYPTPNNPKGLGAGNALFYIYGGSPWMEDYEGWWANPEQNDTWTAKSLAEVTEHNGMDPCSAINTNWEMPTKADWDKVMTTEKIFPRPQGATTTGMDRAFASNLKIAAAGSRKDEDMAFPGERAYLWTRSMTEEENFAWYVYLGVSTASTTGFGGDAKSFGYSVRCVNKNINLGVDLNVVRNDLKISPNPADKVITIETKEQITSVVLVNLNGQKILESNINTIDISKLQPGVYIVNVNLKNGTSVSKKIIKK